MIVVVACGLWLVARGMGSMIVFMIMIMVMRLIVVVGMRVRVMAHGGGSLSAV
jgi:hypothetical protein